MRGLGLWGQAVLSVAVLLVGSVTAQQKGTFTDSRDGQKYKTVKIGTQTWTAENMNVKTGTSWCYDDDESNCKKYGRLYAWSTAAKMACPDGWHLPSNKEWTVLVPAAGSLTAGKKLKSKSGWNNNEGKTGNGTDVFGFSALPGGLRNDDGDFYSVGNSGNWWTSEEDEGNAAYNRVILYDDDGVGGVSVDKSVGFSVRCVADSK